jgi:hypothetical protein
LREKIEKDREKRAGFRAQIKVKIPISTPAFLFAKSLFDLFGLQTCPFGRFHFF